jgi:AcrR family transcriptional regulator
LGSERQERRKSKTRQALLDAALRLFAERGIYTPSIEEITEGADLGKGTFYKYFAAREDLIAALVNQGFDLLFEHLKGALPSGIEPKHTLRALFREHGRFFRERPEYLLVLHQARGWLKLPGKGDGPARQEFTAYVDRLETLIPVLRGGPTPQPTRRRRLALAVAGGVSGILSFRHILGEDLDGPDDLADDVALLSGFLKK